GRARLRPSARRSAAPSYDPATGGGPLVGEDPPQGVPCWRDGVRGRCRRRDRLRARPHDRAAGRAACGARQLARVGAVARAAPSIVRLIPPPPMAPEAPAPRASRSVVAVDQDLAVRDPLRAVPV